MPTRLARFAEGILEAAWLAAIIVVPVFFNVYSSRIFEPDKITLLRSLALVILAALALLWMEAGQSLGSLRGLLRVPLVAPALTVGAVYLISTLFSVTRYTSFWGSYQRLQGTYTTLAYLVIFAALVLTLRRRVQVERLISAAIYAGLPVSLYGILQRYHADPIPWGGDVSARIAANMGNSIFVAAFLIMVFPPTLMRVVESFEALVREHGAGVANFARATLYVFALALQLVALYFSGSRGPWLGWAAGMVLLWLGLSLVWRRRWMTISGVGLALLAGAFLVTLNIPNGPLEGLRTRPEFGRLGQLLDAESRTGQVRTLIWTGASELTAPHPPLEYPDGRRDLFNVLRPWIGYGPESMYVTFNRFYQPELTLVEKRNASPDRAHNETWDSLAITGVLGLLAYLTLFGSVIYYGLKWLGLVPSRVWRRLFVGLYIGVGIVMAGAFFIWRGPAYLGVALPFGMILGVLVYLIAASLKTRIEFESSSEERLRAYLLLGLLAAVTAHFVEINFGIAIAATRTYFWVYAALMLLVGHVLVENGEYRRSENENNTTVDERPAEGVDPTGRSGRKKRLAKTAAARPAARPLPSWLNPAMIAGLLTALVLGILGYEFISNASRGASAAALIVDSLTRLNEAGDRSYGLTALLLTTWLAGCILLVSESPAAGSAPAAWAKTVAAALGVSVVVSGIFWLWHASGLAALNRVQPTDITMVVAQVARSEGLITRFYMYLLAVVFSLAIFLPETWPAALRRSAASLPAGAAALGVVLILISVTNLRVIQADMAFKTAEVFARPGSWPVAIEIYDRARDLAPNEDYYYLFLGRAYLEYAKTIENPVEREQLVEAAAEDLREAQRINPLNTDHTANLARLYSLWSSFETDPLIQAERAETANNYFERALALSPMNSRLWNEWAVHALNYLDDPEAAYEYLMTSTEIDPWYDWTWGLLGDYYNRSIVTDPQLSADQKTEALIRAAEYYTQAVQLAEAANVSQVYSYLLSYGSMATQLGELDRAIAAYRQALETLPDTPDRWRVEAALAQLFAQMGDLQSALQYARQALAGVPEEQREMVEELIQQYGGGS